MLLVKERLARRAIISATHVSILRSDEAGLPDGLVAGKEIFATHYVNASLETVSRFHNLTDRQIRREIARKALRRLLPHRRVYAYEFKGIRHDTGNKLGFLRAVVYFALRHPELAEPFAQHLRSLDLHPVSRSGRGKDHPPVHIPGLI